MDIICMDLEGVLVPEIWVAFAKETGIRELERTTRDEPDYDKLMRRRIEILKEHNLGIGEIRRTITTIEPFEGAKEFLDTLRSFTQAVILSDTFDQFAMPLMKKLDYPALFCNTLTVDPSGVITGYRMRCKDTKLTSVKAFQSMGYDTIAFGDSFNDLDMIKASRAGFLFRTTDEIREAHKDVPAFDTYDALLQAIREVMQ